MYKAHLLVILVTLVILEHRNGSSECVSYQQQLERENMQIWGVSPSFKLQSDLNTHTHTRARMRTRMHAHTHVHTHPADIAEVQDSIGY